MKNIITEKTNETTVIHRREIQPLQMKACRAMESYERAVGCGSLVVGSSGKFINMSNDKKPSIFCEICRACYPDSSKSWKENEYPCSAMHNEIHANSRDKNSYIYTCDIGFAFWTSPLYAGGRYAGSLASGHTLTVPRAEAAELFCSRYKAKRENVLDLLSGFPERDHEEVNALARMLLVCAGKLSSSPGEQNIEKKFFEDYAANTQDKERVLLAALRRGDRSAASLILEDLFAIVQKSSLNNFNCLQFFSIELAVLLSRAAADGPMLDESYCRCLIRLRDSKTSKELSSALNSFIDALGNRIFSFQGVRHASALRKAERFIWDNYTRKISLKEIASESGLSAPYFSTIFKNEMGINLSHYLNQLRIEKAISYLDETKLSLNDIASACGFEDQSWFSKIFKSHMGLSPGKYREQGHAETEGGEKI